MCLCSPLCVRRIHIEPGLWWCGPGRRHQVVHRRDRKLRRPRLRNRGPRSEGKPRCMLNLASWAETWLFTCDIQLIYLLFFGCAPSTYSQAGRRLGKRHLHKLLTAVGRGCLQGANNTVEKVKWKDRCDFPCRSLRHVLVPLFSVE